MVTNFHYIHFSPKNWVMKTACWCHGDRQIGLWIKFWDQACNAAFHIRCGWTISFHISETAVGHREHFWSPLHPSLPHKTLGYVFELLKLQSYSSLTHKLCWFNKGNTQCIFYSINEASWTKCTVNSSHVFDPERRSFDLCSVLNQVRHFLPGLDNKGSHDIRTQETHTRIASCKSKHLSGF